MKVESLEACRYWEAEFGRQDSSRRILPYANIFKMKTIVIDGVSYLYGNVAGLYHFYSKNNKLYNPEKVEKFAEEMSLPILKEYECACDEFGQAYYGFAMTRDSFIHHLPYYMYYVENDIQSKSFYDWMSGNPEEPKKSKRFEDKER